MSSSKDNYFTIADLPSDIIRTIILNAGKDSFENIRLISPMWNVVCIDSLRDRKRLPTIDWLNWTITFSDSTIYAFNMCVPNDHLYFLGLHNCMPVQSLLDTSKSEVSIRRSAYFESMRDDIENFRKMEIWFQKRIDLVFNRCSSIKKFDLNILSIATKELNITTIENTFGNVSINALSIREYCNFNPLFVSNIIKILRSLSIHCLVFKIGETGYMTSTAHFISYFNLLVTLLSEALNVVDFVEIDVTPSNYSAPTSAEWTKYAADLSKAANLSVIFKKKYEEGETYSQLFARKHAEQ